MFMSIKNIAVYIMTILKVITTTLRVTFFLFVYDKYSPLNFYLGIFHTFTSWQRLKQAFSARTAELNRQNGWAAAAHAASGIL